MEIGIGFVLAVDVVAAAAAVVGEDMDDGMVNRCFVREGVGSVVPVNWKPAGVAGAGLVD